MSHLYRRIEYFVSFYLGLVFWLPCLNSHVYSANSLHLIPYLKFDTSEFFVLENIILVSQTNVLSEQRT